MSLEMMRSWRVEEGESTSSPTGGWERAAGSTSRTSCAAPTARAARSATRRSATSRISARSWSSWCVAGCGGSSRRRRGRRRGRALAPAWACRRGRGGDGVQVELARLLDRAPSPERARALAMIGSGCSGRARSWPDAAAPAVDLGRGALRGASTPIICRGARLVASARSGWSAAPAAPPGRGAHIVYDVSSSYFEGRSPAGLLAFGYSGDRRRGSLQIVYGLLCDSGGRPIAIKVCPGGVHDDETLPAQSEVRAARPGHPRPDDRPRMVAKADLEALAAEQGAAGSRAAAPQVKKLVGEGPLQLSLFDEQPGRDRETRPPGRAPRRLPQPLVAAERARKREPARGDQGRARPDQRTGRGRHARRAATIAVGSGR